MIRDAMQAHCPVRVFFGFDEFDELIRHKKEKIPFLYGDHAYFNRGYDSFNFRWILNDIHLTRLLDVSAPRFRLPHAAHWRRGENIIFIPGAKNPLSFHKQYEWNDTTLAILARTKRSVVVKAKKDGKLGDYLKHAWCLVSHSSVAGVEAALSGVSVFGPATSPAYPVSNPNLADLENPLCPDREPWLRSLTYAQFHLEEVKNGLAWEIINEHQHLRRASNSGRVLVEAHRPD